MESSKTVCSTVWEDWDDKQLNSTTSITCDGAVTEILVNSIVAVMIILADFHTCARFP